ncbi:MAG: carbohydrate kinase [Polyangiales bacterium]
MIVCFGEALIDLYAAPLDASPAEASAFVPHVGGAPANVAITLGRLGVPVRFVGAVGRDGHGDRLLRALGDAGVETEAVQRRAERTGIAFVRVATTGERSFLFYRQGGADYALDAEGMLRAAPLRGARRVLFGSSAFVAEPLATAARALLDAAVAQGVSVAVDLNARPHLWPQRAALLDAARRLLEVADVVKASDDDLTALGLDASLDALRAHARPDALLALTRGAAGWEASWGASVLRGDAVPTTCIDATGAGDAFTAGLLAALDGVADAADEGALRAALTCAGALGARAVTVAGATTAMTPPWPVDVQNLLQRKELRS